MTDRGRHALDRARPAAWAINQPDVIGLSPDAVALLVAHLETVGRTLTRLADDADADA